MDFLNDKKTYLVAIMTGVLAALQAYGIVFQNGSKWDLVQWGWLLLGMEWINNHG